MCIDVSEKSAASFFKMEDLYSELEAKGSPDTLLAIYQTTRAHNP